MTMHSKVPESDPLDNEQDYYDNPKNKTTKTIKDIEESLNICDHSVEEWKQEALEHLENIEANFSLHAMNPTSSSRLSGEREMLKAMINFIKNN